LFLDEALRRQDSGKVHRRSLDVGSATAPCRGMKSRMPSTATKRPAACLNESISALQSQRLSLVPPHTAASCFARSDCSGLFFHVSQRLRKSLQRVIPRKLAERVGFESEAAPNSSSELEQVTPRECRLHASECLGLARRFRRGRILAGMWAQTLKVSRASPRCPAIRDRQPTTRMPRFPR
jgi:hypothetical protein